MACTPRIRPRAIAIGFVVLAALGGMALAADKYTLQVPDGLVFSGFRGYEDWQVVSMAQTDEVLKVIVANPVMIAAYKAGIPGNGGKFPGGSKIAKIQWTPKKSTEAPFSVNVPDALKNVFFIEKDSRRFPGSGGWGYALFNYTAASDTFAPDGAALIAGLLAIRPWPQRTTFFTRIRSDERQQVITERCALTFGQFRQGGVIADGSSTSSS